MLKLGEIVTLNNNKQFVVVNAINYENNQYAYLVELYNDENTKIYLVNGDSLTEIKDNNLINTLENIFVNSFKA